MARLSAITAFMLAALVVAASAQTDICAQYQTCETCLNTNTSVQARADCGWCHVNIRYTNGTIGGRCADILIKDWICPNAEFDTYGCVAGYQCDQTTGTCSKAKAGDGFANISICQEYCHPHPHPDVYICNTTTYTCDKCADPTDPNCGDEKTACANCNAPDMGFTCVKNSSSPSGVCSPCLDPSPTSDCKPDFKTGCANCSSTPTGLWTCNRTATSAVCQMCFSGDQANCSDIKTACSDCSPKPHPPPPPPPGPTPPPPPPPQHKNFTCNLVTLVCEQSPAGSTQADCDSKCSNHTPSEFFGTYRGVQAQHNAYVMGEFDFNFSTSVMLWKDPTGTISHGKVTVNGSLTITFIDGPNAGKVLKGIKTEVNNGPETLSVAFAFGAFGADAPTDMGQAMAAKNGETVYVMSSCLDWKKTCNFQSVFPSALRNKMRLLADKPSRKHPNVELVGAVEVPSVQGMFAQRRVASAVGPELGATDPCNQFKNCSACIGQRSGDLACGWCMGGDIVYNETGDLGFRCGGYVQGQPFPFVCQADFRTSDCTGWECNYTATTPTCTETPDGTFSTQAECQQECKNKQYSKCDHTTKQCNPCTRGSPNCTEADVCNIQCNQQYTFCNFTTYQCMSCNPDTDPKCTMSKGECSTECTKEKNTFGKCDPHTGQCAPCDPHSNSTGCVANCNTTCSKSEHPYGCNQTTKQCVVNTGNMTLEACATACSTHTGKYGCDFTHFAHPTCVEGEGTDSEANCEKNCFADVYAKCIPDNGTCVNCNPSNDTDCKYTRDYCLASCSSQKKKYVGVWRGIEISTGFVWGEWDFTFYGDDTVAFELHASGSMIKYEGTVTSSGGSGADEQISIAITQAPSGGPLTLNVGDKLGGIYMASPGYTTNFQFLYLGTGAANAQAASSFDTAMSGMEFVLVGCQHKDTCDFSASTVPE